MLEMLSRSSSAFEGLGFENDTFRNAAFVAHLLPTFMLSESSKDLLNAYHFMRGLDLFNSPEMEYILNKAGSYESTGEKERLRILYKWYLTDVDSYGVLDPVVGSTPAAELDKLVNRILEKLEYHVIILRPIRHRDSDEAREQAEAAGIGFSEAYAMIQEQRRATI